MAHATLAAKFESQGRTADIDVPVEKSGEAERPVRTGVLVVADTNEALLEQLHNRREYFFARQPGARQIGCGSRANPRQRLGEHRHPVVLRFIARCAPVWMVSVLFATSRVAASGLDVAAGIGADPDVGPRRRHRESGDPLQLRRTANDTAIRTEVPEPERPHLAADA